MSVDEIDTILLLQVYMIANRLRMKDNSKAKLHTNRPMKINRDKKFSSL